MTDKVYVVTTGCYSDYSIDSIFLNKKDAKDHANKLDLEGDYWGGVRVEEWDLHKSKKSLTWIAWSKPGSIEVDYVATSHIWDNEPKYVVTEQYAVGKHVNSYKVFLHADTKEIATKIAADLFREHKALNG